MDELREFKDKLIELFRDELNASDDNFKKINDCKSLSDIVSFFENSDDIANSFDVEDLKSEIKTLNEEVKDLQEDHEREVDDLKDEISKLENLADNLKDEIFNSQTHWDEQKYELFLEYHHKFTPIEFEKLLTMS